MREIKFSAENIVGSILHLASTRPAYILDSCGIGHKGSHLLIAGFSPLEEISIFESPQRAIEVFDEACSGDSAAIFTLSYELGRSLQGLGTRHAPTPEPLIYLARLASLVIHDYATGRTVVVGEDISQELARSKKAFDELPNARARELRTNLSGTQYLQAVETVKEEIRKGNTYQANLTRLQTVTVPKDLTGEIVFARLRHFNPAPFMAFIKRPDSTVISASPERFFRVEDGRISASPIKGTRPRGANSADDARLRDELVASNKDRAENIMIVDLLRNDIGRVCKFGSVRVESLCEVEELSTLFHLVSTIEGDLNDNVLPGDVIRALFPCGSITGAPKISTMRILDDIEASPRGLSMGAIGCYIPPSFGIGESMDLSVAIRTMVIRDGIATFNVGGGIVIDSDPEKEWEETVVKSKALLNALGIEA